jgi:prepilin-type N-terminal cleavage/methylation domain-containing protein
MIARTAGSGARRARTRRGMTLIEVIIAIVILSAAMLGLANFVRQFQHTTSDTSTQTLASDLATTRLEAVKGDRVYATLVTNYNGVVETFTSDPVYKGFTRTTTVTRCASCPTATNDYTTVTVAVTGNNLSATMKKTTIIAAF